MDSRAAPYDPAAEGAPPHLKSHARERGVHGAEKARILADAQERVRRRLAFDLHDGPVQSLLAAALQLRMLSERLPPHLVEEAAQLADTLSTAVSETYGVIEELRPEALETPGVAGKIAEYIGARGDDFGFRVSFSVEGDEPECSDSLKIALFRVVQEALNNCRRHSAAHSVHVQLSFAPGFTVCRVRDDGRGFSATPEPLAGGQSLGITGMRERVELLGGTLSVDSAPGAGTLVTAVIPSW